MQFDVSNANVGIIGLGYVGLPLAVEFGKNHQPSVLILTSHVSMSYPQVVIAH